MKHERESVAKRLALAALMGTAIHASIPLPLGTQTLTGQQRDTTLVVMLGTVTPRPPPDPAGCGGPGDCDSRRDGRIPGRRWFRGGAPPRGGEPPNQRGDGGLHHASPQRSCARPP